MGLRDEEPSALRDESAPDHAVTDAADESPGEYEEFVSRLTPWWLLILGIAPTLFFLLRAGGADVLSYIVPVVSGVGAVVQYVTQKQVRLIVAAHGLYYEYRSTRRVIYWGDVHEVVVDKTSRRLTLCVRDQAPFHIALKSFRDWGRLKSLVLSYIVEEVRVVVTPAVGSPLFGAVIVWIFSGFAVLVVAFSPEGRALVYVAPGIALGAIAGFAYVRVVRPTRKARFWTNLGCLLVLLAVIATGIWLAVPNPKLASRAAIIRVLCLAVGLASGFALTVAVVVAPGEREGNVQPLSPAARC